MRKNSKKRREEVKKTERGYWLLSANTCTMVGGRLGGWCRAKRENDARKKSVTQEEEKKVFRLLLPQPGSGGSADCENCKKSTNWKKTGKKRLGKALHAGKEGPGVDRGSNFKKIKSKRRALEKKSGA